MSRKGLKITFVLLFMLLFIMAETGPAIGGAYPSVHVVVSILPQAYFVERIGGSRVTVDVMVPPGKSPATYAPTSEQMAALSKASLFFRIGVPFEEALIPKIKMSSSNIKIVDTRKGICLRRLAGHYAENHDQQHRHQEDGNDPHIWMSPVLVKKQAETICEAFVHIDPENRIDYTDNLRKFIADLDALDSKIRSLLAPLKGGTIFVFHPVFGYFADEYGLKQLAVEIEGKAPKGKDLSNFIKQARQKRVRVVLVQPQFDQRTAGKIADAIHGVVLPVDPLARDYIESLDRIAQQVAAALKN